jgi:hypothetical protein
LINFQQDRLNHVVAQQFKAPVVQQVLDVLAPAGKKVVEADDLVTRLQHPLAKVRAEKARATRNQYSHRASKYLPAD